MNVICISGRLTKDPEVRYTQTGKCVTNITVAVDMVSGGEKKAIFIPCIFWERNAEFVGNYFVKGQMIIVEGSLNIREYEGNDGIKRRHTEVLARRADFCGSRDKSLGAENKSAQNENPQNAFEAMGSFDETVPF